MNEDLLNLLIILSFVIGCCLLVIISISITIKLLLIYENNKKIKLYHISIDNRGGYYFTEIKETILEEIEVLNNINEQSIDSIVNIIENMVENDIYTFGDDVTEIKIKCEKMSKSEFENLDDFNGW